MNCNFLCQCDSVNFRKFSKLSDFILVNKVIITYLSTIILMTRQEL